jgi:hypothetical protein
MEHAAQKTGFPSVQEAAEKYYSVAPIRPATHVPLHGGAIPIQQPPQVQVTRVYYTRSLYFVNSWHRPLFPGFLSCFFQLHVVE